MSRPPEAPASLDTRPGFGNRDAASAVDAKELRKALVRLRDTLAVTRQERDDALRALDGAKRELEALGTAIENDRTAVSHAHHADPPVKPRHSARALASRARWSIWSRGARLLVRLTPGALAPFLWHNPLFDHRWYAEQYPDVVAAEGPLERHYRRHGVNEGRDPNPLFDTSWYMAAYPDVTASGMNPLDHYLLHGASDGRDPGPSFVTNWYLDQYPDVRHIGIHPLLHYLRFGLAEGRSLGPVPGGSAAAVAHELRVGFESLAGWTAWRTRNSAHFKAWRESTLLHVTLRGLEEPITGLMRPAGSIIVDGDNLRETITFGDLNSRMRAALLALAESIELSPQLSPHSVRILGAEAITRASLVLRGFYPRYLGCEYLPTPEEQRGLFPINHLDLNSIAFPDSSFDVFFSSDVFEHVPDLDKALGEVGRILTDNGILVSGFPFLAEVQDTLVRARIVQGAVEHLLPPEYHGNPTRPDEGSLVFSIPAWDILDRCRAAGFGRAEMVLIASARYGVTANDTPGSLVLIAHKDGDAVGPPADRPIIPGPVGDRE